VSAAGVLYTCLFAGSGSDLRPALQDGEAALSAHVAATWSRRGDRYSESRREAAAAPRRRVEMYLVGG
jgi:cyclic pyranopterin phosphate synthase